MNIKYNELKELIAKALENNGVDNKRANLMAKIHADSSLKGVGSHGLNRIPRLVDFIHEDLVDINGDLQLVKSSGAIERYDGNLGFGVINAIKASERACELAKENGIGLVAVKNTTHWMRAGTYGEIIADNGYIGLLFTNTESLMPLWGSNEKSVGNNPVCISIPSKSGNIILDMALSQYSYGKVDTLKNLNKNLPYPGGFDSDGVLTDDPEKILESGRFLPIGYWKGSGLALCVDLLTSVISEGRTTYDMDKENSWNCTGCSQLFIAINPRLLSDADTNESIINNVKGKVEEIDNKSTDSVRFPGQGLLYREKRNLENGIEVDDMYLKQVRELAGNL
ncbi:3-dehydro-L-gulonate 2-dehydrogenase [Anaerococcus murdochii]|uniref:3-dehydro-L-gulonate 2-dehydrogenase n=1 Tax=Anaerococcus murdochii TaxID=411577 RepID=A0ABS7SXA0_9FIRM|nr:3-dehydro-L-gulonate 2-dehydrogenase [Anaerococcus murdochii]MBZ2386168.1 3-dehydro-L-gulonate 2-dehydrogenase [Anaerococcus murdochii]